MCLTDQRELNEQDRFDGEEIKEDISLPCVRHVEVSKTKARDLCEKLFWAMLLSLHRTLYV